MPTFQRKTLRQRLGLDYLRDTLVGTTSFSFAGGVGTVVILDSRQANPAYSGQGMYVNSWLLTASLEYRVASFNAPSGAFVTQQIAGQTIVSSSDYEVHRLLSPSEKDRALDDVIRRTRVRREITFPSLDAVHYYSVDGNSIASPHTLMDPASDVLDIYYYADPSNSLNLDKRRFSFAKIGTSATGNFLYVEPALGASSRIVLDAILAPTLGAGDAATLNLPDERWILSGAAAKCFQMVTADAPAKEARFFQERKVEYAREFTRLSTRYQPLITRKIQFDDPI